MSKIKVNSELLQLTTMLEQTNIAPVKSAILIIYH